jgi:hypothetical protein
MDTYGLDAVTAITELQRAIEQLCRAATSRVDGLPVEDVVLLIVPGRRSGVMGYFAEDRWAFESGGRRLHEIGIIAEHLDEGTEQLATTILHELAHVFAHATGGGETSRGGRYHNARFGTIASEEFGLDVVLIPGRGHFTTGLTDRARVDYADELLALDRARVLVRQSRLRIQRRSGPEGGDGNRKKQAWVYAKCECDTTIRVALDAWRPGRISCDDCARKFVRSAPHQGARSSERVVLQSPTLISGRT